jgi:hypothetical protein
MFEELRRTYKERRSDYRARESEQVRYMLRAEDETKRRGGKFGLRSYLLHLLLSEERFQDDNISDRKARRAQRRVAKRQQKTERLPPKKD